MSRNKPNRSPVRGRRTPESVQEYFFKDGDFSRPRDEIVRRHELWAILDWFNTGMVKHNRWHRRLLRSFQRLPVSRLNPFQWAKLNGKESINRASEVES